MPHYMIQVCYSTNAVKTLVQHPQSREDVISKAAKSVGGKLHSLYFSLGEYDAVLITEFPNNEAAVAFAMSTGSGGAVSKYHTTALLTVEESVNAMKKAQSVKYAPPK